MAHTLPALPYAFDALEPHIDAKTMEIHSQKHHKAYVDNLNKALESAPDLANQDIVTLLRGVKSVPDNVRQAVINNGGGHHNHALFWEIMGPNAGGDPSGDLASAINSTFGGLDNLKAKIKEAALGRFGSGWAWLIVDGGKLAITSTANQDTPLMENKTPILGVDVWEHAYYLKYQNLRASYLDAWWNVVNWKAVEAKYAAAKAGK